MEGVTYDQACKLAQDLEFTGELLEVASEQILRLYDLFISVDATQVEINPFGETPDGRGNINRCGTFEKCCLFVYAVICFDAKINFDDNAKFRQKEIFSMEDTSEADHREVEATKHNLNYIGMDGNIGCLGKTNIPPAFNLPPAY